MSQPTNILPSAPNFESLVDELPLPVIILSADGRTIIWVNTEAETGLGRSRASLLGRYITALAFNSDMLAKQLDKCVRDSRAVTIDRLEIRAPSAGLNQVKRHYQVNVLPHEQGIALILRNPIARGVTHEDGDSGAVSALGRMLAHELKNPLAGIKGAAQLLVSPSSSQEDLELIDLIATETDRIRRLADRMESFGDFDDLSIETVNIHSILRQARLLAQSSGDSPIRFIEKYDPSLPSVAGNNDALMQVAINLIVNASEAINLHGRGSEIILETAYRTGLRRKGPDGSLPLPIEIRIIDNGPGIPERLQEQVF